MPEKEPKLFSWEIRNISRRDFFKLAVVSGGAFLAACSLPEPTPTPEVSKLLETIKVDIPGLTVERYTAEFPDITDEVPESYTEKLKAWFKQPEFSQEGVKLNPSVIWSNVHKQRGPSIIGIDQIRPGHGAEFFYFNIDKGRFYTNILPSLPQDGSLWEYVGDDEKRILGWKLGYATPAEYNVHVLDDLTYDGKISYGVGGYIDTVAYGKDRWAQIIADVPNATKTIITDSDQRRFERQLSEKGNKLLLSFPDDRDSQRGTYLVDLDNWQVRFSLDKPSKTIFLNEDGSLLYQLSGLEIEKSAVGYLYNTIKGERRTVSWPSFRASYGHAASRNLQFIARTLGMFPASKTVEGQWGIMVYDDFKRIFYMVSSPGRSLIPQKIYNDGTIYTTRGDVFKFEGGTYKLVKTGDGKPNEVRVVTEVRGQ